MATKRLGMYEKALRRATKSYGRWSTEADPTESRRLADKVFRDLEVLDHFQNPQSWCVCEACCWWADGTPGV